MANPDATLEAVVRVTRILECLGLGSALIGGWAMVVHGYERPTEDVDLAAAFNILQGRWPSRLTEAFEAEGFRVEVRIPEPGDSLGGLIRLEADGIDPIEIVNFYNPWYGSSGLAEEAIATAIESSSGIRSVDLPHLIGRKLYAGMRGKSPADVLELLRSNPDADLDAIGALCGRHGMLEEWQAILKLRAVE